MTDQNKSIFSFPQASSSSSTPNAPAFSFGQSPANTSNLFGSGKTPTITTPSAFGSILNQQSGNTAFGSTDAGRQGGAGTGTGIGTSGGGSGGGDKPQNSLFGMSTANSSGATGTTSLFGNALGGSNNKPVSPLTGGAGGGIGEGQTFGGLGGPSSGAGSSASPFSLGKPSEAGSGLSLFGQTKPQSPQMQGTSGISTTTSSSTAPAQKSLFSAGGFSTGNTGAGTSSPLSGPGLSTPASVKPTFQFPTGSTTPAGPPPAKPDTANNNAPSEQQTGSSLFGGISGQGITSQPPQNGLKPASATGGLFSNLGKSHGDAATTSQTQSDTAVKTSQPFAEPVPAKTPFSASLFPALGSSKAGSSQAPSPAATTAASSADTRKASTNPGLSLFGNANVTASSASTTATATSGPVKNGPNFGTSSAPSTSAFGTASTTATGAGAGTGTGAGAGPTLFASSTSGPAPPPQSRLKNKSMDDIITRWATDLAKYQKEFQQQSEKIATWDRLLVENSDKISKLYIRTFQAQRDAAEVERQLTTVENQQDELSSWLDKYEKEVDEIMSRQVGQGEGMNGPDQERERTYKLAEKVSDRLTEMSQDLSSMIEEINSVSATLSKTNKPDNPLSQIVRVLNGHLSLLQQIDEGSASLQSKVAAAQKESQRLGTSGYHGIGTDPADDFYRSFVGGRR